MTKFYSSQVNGTPEQYKMTLPGDDLVPEGSPRFKRLTHVEDLDAPCDEVWKHVYQLNTTTAGFYSFTFFEKMFGLSVDNTFMVEQAWQDPDYYKPGDMFCWSYAGFGAEVADMVPGKYLVWFADTRDGTRTPGAIPATAWNAVEPLELGHRPGTPRQWQPDAHLLPVEHLGLRGVQSDLGPLVPRFPSSGQRTGPLHRGFQLAACPGGGVPRRHRRQQCP